MALPYITWNRLYAAQLRKRAFAKARILVHFVKMRLSERGVENASVRYVFRIFHCCAFNTDQFCRPTGWHRESGTAGAGSHITVDFQRQDGKHIVMHHVYWMDVKVHFLNSSADISRP
jgi:hypothetical protein